MYDKIESQAQSMALAAKPGIFKHGDKTYTLVFCQKEWVYKVYEDGFFYININTKKITEAKRFLKHYLSN